MLCEGGRMKASYEQLRLALDLALIMIMRNEPGDSRAVSDEAVALAAVSCDLVNNEVMDVIAKAIVNDCFIAHRNKS
jgi:hypothetical protein